MDDSMIVPMMLRMILKRMLMLLMLMLVIVIVMMVVMVVVMMVMMIIIMTTVALIDLYDHIADIAYLDQGLPGTLFVYAELCCPFVKLFFRARSRHYSKSLVASLQHMIVAIVAWVQHHFVSRM